MNFKRIVLASIMGLVMILASFTVLPINADHLTPPANQCDTPPGRLLVDHTFVRSTGAPVEEVVPFHGRPGGTGLVCIDLQGVNKAKLDVNEIPVIDESDVLAHVAHLERFAHLINDGNQLAATLMGQPGASMRVQIYSGATLPQ